MKMILCINKNGGLGKNNNLLYHISEDLKRFKTLTTNNIIVMGRKTFESMNSKALPNRLNIVLSNTLKHKKLEGLIICDKEDLKKYINNTSKDIFIIGGESLYNNYINLVDTIYLTIVDDDKKDFDAKFNFNKYKEDFNLIESINKFDSKNNLSFKFETYTRKQV